MAHRPFPNKSGHFGHLQKCLGPFQTSQSQNGWTIAKHLWNVWPFLHILFIAEFPQIEARVFISFPAAETPVLKWTAYVIETNDREWNNWHIWALVMLTCTIPTLIWAKSNKFLQCFGKCQNKILSCADVCLSIF